MDGLEERMICRRRQRAVGRPGGAMLLVGLAASALLSGGAFAAIRPASHHRRGRAARSLHATDTARLHYVSAAGSLLYEQGHASGTLPGTMRVHLRVSATFTGSFTIYASGGAIYGHGSAKPHGSGVWESFAGSLVVSGGSGRFRHAHGRASLYGAFNRKTYALVVQTSGTLYY